MCGRWKKTENGTPSYPTLCSITTHGTTEPSRQHLLYVWGGKSVPADIEADPKQKPFAIGDRVRHVKQRRFFGKGGAEWSKEIYVVSGRIGNRYSIATSLDAVDEPVGYRAYELQKTGDDVREAPGSPANPELIAEIEAVHAERRQRQLLAREHTDAENVVEGPRVRRKTYKARESEYIDVIVLLIKRVAHWCAELSYG